MKRKTIRRKQNKALFGVSASTKSSMKQTAISSTLSVGAGFLGAGIGAALGKYSLLTGIPLLAIGIHKKSFPIAAAGIGMAFSNVPQLISPPPTENVSGIDFKARTEGAKDRVKVYFENFKDKLFMSSGNQSMGELSESTSYFMSPYSSNVGNLDLSELEKIQVQVAQMNQPVSGLMEEEFNNVEF